MLLSVFLAYFSAFSINWTLTESKNDTMKIELVQVIFRHGARTPSQHEAMFFNITEPTIYKPYGFLELVDGGKEQVRRLGRTLRKEYDGFLGAYKPGDVYAYTSATSRTKLSLELVLSELYPSPQYTGKDHITYEEAAQVCDAIISPQPCPHFAATFEKEKNNSVYEQQMSKFTELLKYLENNTGRSYSDINFGANTYYVGNSHRFLNLPVPDWYTDAIHHQLEELTLTIINSWSMTNRLKKLNGGTMIRRMLENIELNDNSTTSRKIYLYSAHDLTISAFNIAQKMNSSYLPPYGSAVILEKYGDEDGKKYIKMRSFDGSHELLESLQINGSKDYYPLSDYKKMVEDVIPTDEDISLLRGEGGGGGEKKFDALVIA